MKTKLSIAILFWMVATTAFGSKTGLPFIQDDYAKARAQAKQHHLPIFVECWAPW